MPKSDLIIKEPSKPLVSKIIASFLFTCISGCLIYLFLYKNLLNRPEKWVIIVFFVILLLMVFLFSFMIIASHSIHLDFEQRKIQHQYHLGLFKYKEVWQNLIDLKYISVFKTGDYFQINMWYQKNQILNLMTVDDYEKSLKNGFLIAEKLDIDLLDARNRGDHKWVNKTVYKETGEIVYFNT